VGHWIKEHYVTAVSSDLHLSAFIGVSYLPRGHISTLKPADIVNEWRFEDATWRRAAFRWLTHWVTLLFGSDRGWAFWL